MSLFVPPSNSIIHQSTVTNKSLRNKQEKFLPLKIKKIKLEAAYHRDRYRERKCAFSLSYLFYFFFPPQNCTLFFIINCNCGNLQVKWLAQTVWQKNKWALSFLLLLVGRRRSCSLFLVLFYFIYFSLFQLKCFILKEIQFIDYLWLYTLVSLFGVNC